MSIPFEPRQNSTLKLLRLFKSHNFTLFSTLGFSIKKNPGLFRALDVASFYAGGTVSMSMNMKSLNTHIYIE